MAQKCVVGGCLNSSDTIIHYILPEEPKRRSLWLQFIERSKPAGEYFPQSSRVCGDHFSQDSFTKFDLGFTTRLILNIDAVPSIYCCDHATEDGIEEQAAGPGKEVVDKTCSITISSTVSLACVKDEPFEYEVSHVMKPVEETKSASTRRSVKQEKSECQLTAETSSEGSKQLQVNQKADIKPESSRSALGERSKDNKRYSCSTCGQTFRNKCVLMEHENNHMEEQTDRMFHCSICGEGFEQEAFLKAHEKLHKATQDSGEPEFTSSPRQYKHASQGMYKCPICEEFFQKKNKFIVHVKRAHAGCKLMCSFCDKSFVQAGAFFKHIDSHVVVTPFYCSICRVYQVTKQGYLCHMRSHNKKKKGRGKGAKYSHIKQKKEEALKEQMQTEEVSELDAESVESKKTGTVQIVSELDTSLLSLEELSYTSEDTEDSEDIDGTDDK